MTVVDRAADQPKTRYDARGGTIRETASSGRRGGAVLAVLTEEQEMLREMATQLSASVGLTNTSDLTTVDRAKGWLSLSDAGLLGLRIRDEVGAPAASGVELMLIAEALGGAVAPVPFVGCMLATELLALVEAPGEWLEEIATGQVRYGLLLSRDLSGLADVSQLAETVAWDVEEASYALALAGSAEQRRVVRISLGEGFSALNSADLTRRLLRPTVTPDPSQMEQVGRPLTTEMHDGWLGLALTLVSADVVGVMRSALQKAVAYTKERIQYGVPVGSFQAVQHMCAEVLVQSEAAASTTKYAAWAVDALDPAEALMAARTAKAYCSSVAREVTETIMQVYGGIGQTWEHIAHVWTRRALMDRQVLGDESEQLLRIADWRLAGQAGS
jgi:alkylation response protein AidB-like acyl-CoA dehydrogenase